MSQSDDPTGEQPDAPDADSVRDGRNRLWEEVARLN